jgi:hypothetical protein
VKAVSGTDKSPKVVRRFSCALCKGGHGTLTAYRDPFGAVAGPGRWPILTMHTDCFLAYVRAHQAAARGDPPPVDLRRIPD